MLCVLAALAVTGCRNAGNELKFKTVSFSDSVATESITYVFDGRLELPDEGLAKDVREVMRREILLHALGESYSEMRDGRVLEAYADSSFAEFESMFDEDLKPIEGEMPFRISCETRVSGAVSFEWEGLLNYETRFYVYSGGAHGMYHVANYVFDLKTGRVIDEGEIFGEDVDEELHALLVEAAGELRRDSVLPSETDLFSDDFIVANGNVELGEHGLSYVYNPYDIAPYCYGVISIPLDNARVLPLLNRECAVYDYIAGKIRE